MPLHPVCLAIRLACVLFCIYIKLEIYMYIHIEIILFFVRCHELDDKIPTLYTSSWLEEVLILHTHQENYI